MKNRYVRQGNKDTIREMSRTGVGERRIRIGGQEGRIARVLVGMTTDARIITLEQQPGHEPIAHVQEATYRWDYRRDGKSDLDYRAHGDQDRLPMRDALDMIAEAHEQGQLPGRAYALKTARSFSD